MTADLVVDENGEPVMLSGVPSTIEELHRRIARADSSSDCVGIAATSVLSAGRPARWETVPDTRVRPGHDSELETAMAAFGRAGEAMIPALNAMGEQMDRMRAQLAAAADIPLSILFGEPADVRRAREARERSERLPYGPVTREDAENALDLDRALDVACDVAELGGNVALVLGDAAPFFPVLRGTRLRPWDRMLESEEQKRPRASWGTPAWLTPPVPLPSQIVGDIATMIERVRTGDGRRRASPAIFMPPRHGKRAMLQAVEAHRAAFASFGTPAVFVNPQYRDARTWIERGIEAGLRRLAARLTRR